MNCGRRQFQSFSMIDFTTLKNLMGNGKDCQKNSSKKLAFKTKLLKIRRRPS